MTRLLAVDWDRREARCVLAATSGKTFKVLSVGSAPLVDVAEGGGSYSDIGGSLRAALDEQHAGRAVTLVGIDRASVDLMNFTLPPAKDSELPELVVNQAMRESQLAGDDALVDFTACSDDPTEPRPVIAAVLGPQQHQRVQEACAAASLRAQRIVLRPLAAASLFLQTSPNTEDVCLLVNVLAEEADLTVVGDGKPQFLRTVRFPGGLDEDSIAGRLSGEIHRTLLVAQQGVLGGRSVDRLVVFGGRNEHATLCSRLGEDLSLPVTVLDPFKAAGVPGGLAPEHPGRFASLLGMLLDESAGRRHAMDFLHPKRPPKPVDRRRPILAAAGLLAALLLGIGYQTWSEISELDDANEELAQQLRELDGLVKKSAEHRQLVEAVRQWKASEVNWLDEFRDLSLRLPSSRDVIISRITMTPARNGGGQLHLSGLVRDPLVVAEIERRLRDAQHRDVRSDRILPRSGEAYTRTFEVSATVVPRSKDEYAAAARAIAGR
jgi:Tfp pilus assembly PilM family ATPase